MMVKLSKHFCERWEKRVGNLPTPQAVNSIIEDSVRIQRGDVFREVCKAGSRPLSIFWNTDLDLVIYVDPKRQVAVSVLSKKVKPKNKPRASKKRVHSGSGRSHSSPYTPMTMHAKPTNRRFL
ncbi:MAG: hypothetical protein JEZ12_28450 [Desulfobacterium sp.]|nr:hypothetical protein [Desulfobacterium sp.]